MPGDGSSGVIRVRRRLKAGKCLETGLTVREIYSEEKLKTLIKVQSKKMEEAAQGDILARIADFPKKTVQDMMTPMEDAFVLSGSETLDLKLLVTILEKGYTRIPVFEEKNKSNISTVLNVKVCLKIDGFL
ncbi:hypothetical protein Y032_0697g1615 [Ancylostoma ceylanicum]|uniref:CBS domain-containing protein n=1 Tax=Ancylostoma ceylanicum TaxID=53326 RepID=A0A016WIC2_9BILA|nr:hypothetical protein Y032_0697g1615 [Ancylostoma ceylanicum]